MVRKLVNFYGFDFCRVVIFYKEGLWWEYYFFWLGGSGERFFLVLSRGSLIKIYLEKIVLEGWLVLVLGILVMELIMDIFLRES